MRPCSAGYHHDAISATTWSLFAEVGIQDVPAGDNPLIDPPHRLELRNCVCGSTLSRMFAIDHSARAALDDLRKASDYFADMAPPTSEIGLATAALDFAAALLSVADVPDPSETVRVVELIRKLRAKIAHDAIHGAKL